MNKPKVIGTDYLRAHLRQVLAEATNGQRFVVTRRGKELVEIAAPRPVPS